MARIVSITYLPVGLERAPDRFVRVAQSQALLCAGHGIAGDAKAGKHPRRQLNLLSARWLAARAAEGWDTLPGAFGEQLVVEGVDIETLAPGTHLCLGASAWIEITQPRTHCPKLVKVQSQVPPLIGPAGMFARVLTGGHIYVGSPVRCLPAPARAATNDGRWIPTQPDTVWQRPLDR